MMLVLSRKLQQEILIGDNVKVTVLKVKGNTVRLGIEAPRSVRVVRGELPPIEEPMAEITIVLDNQDCAQPNEEPADVVPFRTAVRSTHEKCQREESRLNPANTAGPPSITFKNRLPATLQHNRLQQIVNELANKGV
jgi:carbon storage regulator CsrA